MNFVKSTKAQIYTPVNLDFCAFISLEENQSNNLLNYDEKQYFIVFHMNSKTKIFWVYKTEIGRQDDVKNLESIMKGI